MRATLDLLSWYLTDRIPGPRRRMNRDFFKVLILDYRIILLGLGHLNIKIFLELIIVQFFLALLEFRAEPT